MDPVVNPTFVKDYYNNLDDNPAALGKYYKEDSLFSLDGVTYEGETKIVELFTSSSFQPCKHNPTKDEHLPVPLDDYMVVVKVVGTASINGSPVKNFSQTFQMKWDEMGRMYVANSMLSLFESEDKTVDDQPAPAANKTVHAPVAI